jgi:Dolichyl-phosphate-mannose-protein mannosyltransferase
MTSAKTRDKGWSAERFINSLRSQSLLGQFVIVLLLLAGTLPIAVGTVLGVVKFTESYPDSATLLIISEFINSGHIYPDINLPPYQVTIYGPLTYVLPAIPYWLAQVAGITPQVPVRLYEVGALFVCVLLIFLINRRLYGPRPIAWLCALFAGSAFLMAPWTTQVRGDLPALGFALLSVYLYLLTNGRQQAIGAAICAGIAVLIKQTFIAVPIATITWLLYKRRYKEAAFWSTGFALTAVGGYAIAWWREPLILEHIAALRHPVFEYTLAMGFIWDAVSQPVVPFAALGGFLVLWKPVPERLFFLIYCVAAWLVAILTIPQAGGNTNYFWEPLLASAVLAGPGLYELQRRVDRAPILVIAMLYVLLLRSFLPALRHDLDYLRTSYLELREYQARKTKWASFLSIISGRRLLSTSPEVTFHSITPEIPDPFLNSVLELRGQWNSSPVVAQMDAGVFDLIVIGKGTDKVDAFRGIRFWSDGMWAALKRRYELSCVFENFEIWLPRQGSREILPSLSAIGCSP